MCFFLYSNSCKQEPLHGARKIEMNAKTVHCKNIRMFYGKIIGNQLPVHFPSFFTGARKHFQESGTER